MRVSELSLGTMTFGTDWGWGAERTNIAELSTHLVPQAVSVVTIDLSNLSVAHAVPQIDALDLEPDAHLVALVKPMFELGRSSAPVDERSLAEALASACRGLEAAGWIVHGTMRSPIAGGRGVIELLVWAKRSLDST